MIVDVAPDREPTVIRRHDGRWVLTFTDAQDEARVTLTEEQLVVIAADLLRIARNLR